MDAEESYSNSTLSDLDISSGADRLGTLALLEGLELMEAFSKIKREKVRQEIIALARRLSTIGT
jgi:hypothetical protein